MAGSFSSASAPEDSSFSPWKAAFPDRFPTRLPTTKSSAFFTPDGRALLVATFSDVPARVERLDLWTGRRELFKTLGPADLTGVLQIAPIAISDDGKSHAYSCRRMTSHLFLVGGAR